MISPLQESTNLAIGEKRIEKQKSF